MLYLIHEETRSATRSGSTATIRLIPHDAAPPSVGCRAEVAAEAHRIRISCGGPGEASRCIGLDADALREAAEYLQLQYRKLHESEAYLSPGEWERRSRLVTIKVTDFEFEALSSLAEVTGLTKSQLMRLALAGKAPELGRGALSPPRAAPSRNQTTENTPEDDRFVQGELFPHDEYR